MSKKILVPIAPGTEEMEAVITVDMLRRAGFDVTVAGIEEICECSRGVKIKADLLLEELQHALLFDAVVLPGGLEGTSAFARSHTLGEILKSHKKNERLIAAICAAPTALHHHGIIDPQAKITSHPSVANDLKNYEYSEERVVVDGNLVTSRGAGTAFDFAMKIIEKLKDAETAEEISKSIVYK